MLEIYFALSPLRLELKPQIFHVVLTVPGPGHNLCSCKQLTVEIIEKYILHGVEWEERRRETILEFDPRNLSPNAFYSSGYICGPIFIFFSKSIVIPVVLKLLQNLLHGLIIQQTIFQNVMGIFFFFNLGIFLNGPWFSLIKCSFHY